LAAALGLIETAESAGVDLARGVAMNLLDGDLAPRPRRPAAGRRQNG